MVATTVKGNFHRKGPRIVAYREYSKFNNIAFREMVGKELNSNSSMKQDFSVFNSTIKNILNRQAPLKKKYLRANDGPFMIKELRKAIMTRSRLKSIFNRVRTTEKWTAIKS